MIDRPDWSTSTEQPGTALVPAASAEPPTSTVEDLALVNAPAAEPNAAAIDEEEAARYRKLIADGIFTPEDLQRHYGLSDAELDALSNPPRPRTRAGIDTELAAIEKRMRDDRRGYFKDEAQQARYRELLDLRGKLPAKAAKAERSQAGDQGGARQSIDREIAQIQKTIREDRRAYDKDPKMQARYLELIDAREQATELARQGEQVQTTVQAVLDAVDDPEAFEAGFDAMFDALPEHALLAIRTEFARPPESPARPASEADVKRFASTTEGAELVEEWGKKAPGNVAIVRARLDRMLSAGDMDRAARWLDELPAKHAAAVLRALAG